MSEKNKKEVVKVSMHTIFASIVDGIEEAILQVGDDNVAELGINNLDEEEIVKVLYNLKEKEFTLYDSVNDVEEGRYADGDRMLADLYELLQNNGFENRYSPINITYAEDKK
jgi:hypothetical protein